MQYLSLQPLCRLTERGSAQAAALCGVARVPAASPLLLGREVCLARRVFTCQGCGSLCGEQRWPLTEAYPLVLWEGGSRRSIPVLDGANVAGMESRKSFSFCCSRDGVCWGFLMVLNIPLPPPPATSTCLPKSKHLAYIYPSFLRPLISQHLWSNPTLDGRERNRARWQKHSERVE